MFNTIKNIFNNTLKNTLAEHYQSRLDSSHNIVEVEAIIAMNRLLSLHDDESQSKVLK